MNEQVGVVSPASMVSYVYSSAAMYDVGLDLRQSEDWLCKVGGGRSESSVAADGGDGRRRYPANSSFRRRGAPIYFRSQRSRHVSNIISNEVPVSGKMDGFSTIDGFAEIIECLAEMTQYIANEPSVGLFYIQQHTQTTVPNLVKLKNNASGKSHEMSLETEDSEDSVMMVRSIKECGFPIVDEMVKDITKSLAIMSTKEPRKGLINNSSPRFHLGRTSSWASGRWNRKEDMSPQYSRSNSSYFTKVFKSAQERAGNMNHVQSNTSELSQTKNQKLLIPALPYAVASTSSTDIEVEELPLSCQIVEERQDESETDANLTKGQLPFTSGNFDAFKADKESKLEECLGDTENNHSHTGETTARNMLTHSDADEALT